MMNNSKKLIMKLASSRPNIFGALILYSAVNCLTVFMIENIFAHPPWFLQSYRFIVLAKVISSFFKPCYKMLVAVIVICSVMH